MKSFILVAILFFATVCLFSQPKGSPAKNENTATQTTPAPTPQDNDRKSTAETDSAKRSSPHWYTSSEWWLVIIAALTGIAISYQAREMAKTTEIIEKQATLMKLQTDTLVEYNKATREAADAAAKSAAATERTVGLLEKQVNLMEGQLEEMRSSTNASINKDRGRAHLGVSKIQEYEFRYAHEHFGASFMLSSSGGTKVFVDDCRVVFIKTENADITPDYSKSVQIASGGTVIPKPDSAPNHGIRVWPNGILTSSEMEQIQRGELFLHFYGFVRFRDIFERTRRKNIHVRWSGKPESKITEWQWKTVGAAGENQETEEKQPNGD